MEDQLEYLEQDLIQMLENIQRIKQFKKEKEFEKWTPSCSRVVGELKHRAIVLKQRLTLVQNISTSNLLNK